MDALPHVGASGALRWRYEARAVPLALGPYVNAIVAYEEHAPGHRVLRQEVPRPGPVLIVQREPAIRIGGERCPRAFVAGGMARARMTTGFDERQAGIEVELSPLGACAILGVDGAALAGRVTALADLAPAPPRVTPAEIEAWLVRRAATSRPDLRLTGWIVDELVRSGGVVAVRELVRRSGYSHRHLLRLCEHQLGTSPKALGRMIRFTRVVGALRRLPWHAGGDAAAPLGGWARLARELGYADHSHLVRETRAIAGATPGELVRLLGPELEALPRLR